MKTTEEKFLALMPKFDVVPFTQSLGWNKYSSGLNLEYWIDSETDTNIGFWGITTNRKFIGKKLIINGLCLKADTSQKLIKNFLTSVIAESDADIFHYSDIEDQNANFEVSLRRSGFKRPLALSLCPMTIKVDCQKEFQFHRNWKRQVKKSLELHHTFNIVETPSDQQLADFVNLFDMLKDRKHLGFDLSVESISELTNTPQYFLSFVYDENGKPLCGRMTYLHNGHAYDIFAANSEEGLSTGAIYHNQQALLEYLKSKGVKDFDYGRIPPGTDEMDNIYISKSYSGGSPVIYNGEWEYVKSNLKNWIYNFYRFAVRNSKRYVIMSPILYVVNNILNINIISMGGGNLGCEDNLSVSNRAVRC